MKQIEDCRVLEPVQNRLLKAGAVVNGFPSREDLERDARAGTLWTEEFPQGLLILRKREGFQRVNFMLARGESFPDWTPEECTVIEIPFRPGDLVLQELDRTFDQRGFSLELSRVRLTRKPSIYVEDIKGVGPAGIDQLDRIQVILTECFSPLTGCLPQKEELLDALGAGRIFTCKEGILHFNKKGRATEIRHLAVEEGHRGEGIGRSLVAAYLAKYGGHISRVWTGEGNASALGLYHSFDYTEDAWRSNVRVYRKDK